MVAGTLCSSARLCSCNRMLVVPQAVARSNLRECTRSAFSNALLRRWMGSWSLDPSSGMLSTEGLAPKYQAIIGVEIHAQLDIPTKLFSSAPAVSPISAAPNTAVHPYDAAVPGVLPVLSRDAVQAAVVAAHLLNCKINETSRFERKHYSYADLPHSYQITQQRWPLAQDGTVEVSYTFQNNSSAKKKGKSEQRSLSCRITRIQLEQDSGKTIQVLNGETGFRESRVDLNRAGQALVEIVSEPDLKTAQEAAALVEHVRQLFKHVGICNGRMEEGSLRCDLNVNIRDLETGERSARVEVKNLNSLRQISDAAVFELVRHAKEWPSVEETRTWNIAAAETELLRRKDQAQDYRFLPDPDLLPLVLDSSVFDGLELNDYLETRIPELPSAAIERFMRDYGLTEYQAQVIAGDPPAIIFLDRSITTAEQKIRDNARQRIRLREMVTNFLINDLFGLVKLHSADKTEVTVSDSAVSPEQLGETMAMVLDGKISTSMAKNLLALLYTTEQGENPAQVAADRGWQLVSNPQQLRSLCEGVVDQHPDEMTRYRKGGKHEIKMFKFLTGKAMAASKGTAEPETLKDILEEILEKRK